MLKKEDFLLLIVIVLSLAGLFYFHVRSRTVENAIVHPRIYTTPAPSSEIELKMIPVKKRP